MVTMMELIIPASDMEHGMTTEKTTLSVLEGLAHELRTPLGAIGGYAELLRLGMHGPVTTAQAEVLARITRNQDIMVGIITDFMAYAELDAGAVRLVPTLAVMSDIVRATAAIVGAFDPEGVPYGRTTAFLHTSPCLTSISTSLARFPMAARIGATCPSSLSPRPTRSSPDSGRTYDAAATAQADRYPVRTASERRVSDSQCGRTLLSLS